jgi:hypothetical protein
VNYFLFEVKEKERALLEDERAENYGKNKNTLSNLDN